MLLEAKADTTIQDNHGRTPLHSATSSGDMNPQIVRMLLQAGADVSCQDDEGQTALHYASKFKIPEIVKMLLVAGADYPTQDNNVKVAWHHVMGSIINMAENKTRHTRMIFQTHSFWKPHAGKDLQHRRRRMLQVVLLEAKSTVMVQDYEGATPLEYLFSYIPLANLFAHALTINVSGIYCSSIDDSSCNSTGLKRSAILASYCETLLTLYELNPLMHFTLG
jgi:hypothetical protein